MKIDRNNYEEYFLDYLEGRLTTDETAGLFAFADENPDLKALLDGEEEIKLMPDESISFHPKSALKKTLRHEKKSGSMHKTTTHKTIASHGNGIDAANYEDVMIRYYENDLNDAEKAALANFMKDSPTYIREFEIFGNTLLKTDTGTIYPHKNRLKRKTIVLPGIKRVVAIISVAASVLLFSTLFLRYSNQTGQSENHRQVAQGSNNHAVSKTQITPSKSTKEINPATLNDVVPSDQTAKTNQEFASAESGSKSKNSSIVERTTFEVPSSLNMHQSAILATTNIKAPRSIDRRTDFDGITSVAYYDPDPDALPLNTEGRTIGGRLGSTLALGISQTAGTIARDPEMGRLLRGKFSLADIASLGLAGFNLITDSKLSLSRNYDADGNMKGYSIVDGNKRLNRLPNTDVK